MGGRELPCQGFRATRFQVLENTGYLGTSSHQVSQENSINKRPSIELTVLQNCEPLSGKTLVFMILICLLTRGNLVSFLSIKLTGVQYSTPDLSCC